MSTASTTGQATADPADCERETLERAWEERFHSDCLSDEDLSYARTRKVLVSVAELEDAQTRVLHQAMISEAFSNLQAAQRFAGVLPYQDLCDDPVDRLGLKLEQDLARLIKRMQKFSQQFHERERIKEGDLCSLRRSPAEELAEVVNR